MKSSYIQLLILIGLALSVADLALAQSVEVRRKEPYSLTANFAGDPSNAFYVIDSGNIRQYGPAGAVRANWKIGAGETYRFSPDGMTHAVITENNSDSSAVIYYDALKRELRKTAILRGSQLYIDNTGRSVVVEPRAGSSRLVRAFDADGTLFGSCNVPSCDSVRFAPVDNGFAVDAGMSGVYAFRFTGEKVGVYPTASCWAYSFNGKRIAIFNQGLVTTYEGERVVSTFRADRAAAIKIIYESGRNRIFLLTKKHLYNLRASDGYQLIDYPAEGEGRTFRDMSYSPESDLIALTIHYSYGSLVDESIRDRENGMRLITPEGEEYNYYYQLCPQPRDGYPKLLFNKNGNGGLLIFPNEIHRLVWR